ncbi:sulfotransferase 6B1 [Pristis pectinata]|uniref:sulfotransferase 6B1 n=1 Tax=Pristis pectinata TaxID=685728 RepID=UPI00223D5332|nr:sulfotransferase 6B1 [Pristis pectinata]
MESEQTGERAAAGEANTLESKLQRLLIRASKLEPEEMLFRYKGLLYPTVLSSEDKLQQLSKFEARSEDMCIVSYPKCGFNWVNQLFHDIAAAVQDKPEEGKDEGQHKVILLEFADPVTHEMMKSYSSPRVYGMHLHYENLPPSIIEKKTKVLVVFRNPKDNAVSYYHFCQKNPLLPNSASWDEFFKKYMAGEVAWGSYFDYALIWEKYIDDENVMFITYEELKENLAGGVQKIAEFHGFSLTEEQIHNIAHKGTFQAMSNNSQETHSILGNVFFRKGVVGDWRNLFTEEQSREMDAKFEECLAGTKLGAKLKYDLYCKA